MNRPLLVLAPLVAFAAACGEVNHRDDCRSSAGCPVGEYCARTSKGSVCWADPVPPTVSTVTVACGAAGCLRDGTLVVTAQATDDVELSAVEATVDLDPDHAFPLSRGAGSDWSGTVALATIDFPAFSSEVAVTVRARDGARNETEAVAPAGQRPVVTRKRWDYEAGAPLSAAAVAANGTVLVARSALTDQLHAIAPDGTKAWSRTLGGGTVTEPPSIGAQAIWVGANDGKLYAVALDGSGELASRSCAASGVAKGPPAVLTTGGVDVAFGAFSNGRIYASGPTCVPTASGDPLSSGTAIGSDNAVYAASSTATVKALRRHPWDGAAWGSGWSVDVADTVNAPLVLSDGASVISGSVSGELERTAAGVSSGSVSSMSALAQTIDSSPIILSSGDVVVGDASGLLHRIASDGKAVWDPPVDLGAGLHAPMALAAPGGSPWFLVATEDGRVHALDDAGTILWSGSLTAGPQLGAGNIHTPVACDGSTPCISTAYFGGADGRLYAVIVDGALDTSAPWPKAWHDARNTSRAGGAF